jgi:hypothetical protein
MSYRVAKFGGWPVSKMNGYPLDDQISIRIVGGGFSSPSSCVDKLYGPPNSSIRYRPERDADHQSVQY